MASSILDGVFIDGTLLTRENYEYDAEHGILRFNRPVRSDAAFTVRLAYHAAPATEPALATGDVAPGRSSARPHPTPLAPEAQALHTALRGARTAEAAVAALTSLAALPAESQRAVLSTLTAPQLRTLQRLIPAARPALGQALDLANRGRGIPRRPSDARCRQEAARLNDYLASDAYHDATEGLGATSPDLALRSAGEAVARERVTNGLMGCMGRRTPDPVSTLAGGRPRRPAARRRAAAAPRSGSEPVEGKAPPAEGGAAAE